MVETRLGVDLGHGTGVWVAYWMELRDGGKVSVEIDEDRAANITQATWGRARRVFGVPERILVLDEDTAQRVRRAVPARVAVVVADDPRLRALVEPPDGDDLDQAPFPAPRARC